MAGGVVGEMGSPVTASPLESFLFRQVGSGDGRNPFVPVLGRVKVSEAATWSAAWRRRLSMPPSRSRPQRSSHWATRVQRDSQESAKPPRHDQHGPAPLGRDGVTSPSRMLTSSTTWAASTVGSPSSPRSSRAVTNLFGRLEAAGAPRLADWAAIARRWAE